MQPSGLNSGAHTVLWLPAPLPLEWDASGPAAVIRQATEEGGSFPNWLHDTSLLVAPK